MVMFVAQLAGRKSLRDIVMNVSAQSNKIYHLGIKLCSRATLARVNEKQPASFYEDVFFKLLGRCRQVSPGRCFKFKNKLYLDATPIDLCLSLFPWAKFRKAKGVIKLHVGLDADGYFPTFFSLTDGNLLAFLKFKAQIDLSMQQTIRLLQLNLFERRDLLALFKKTSTTQLVECRQFSLFEKL